MKTIKIRITKKLSDELNSGIFRRYPFQEWATFFLCSWYCDPEDKLTSLNIVSLVPPEKGDISETVAHVELAERYTLRMALGLESHRFAPGVIHSHPEDYHANPSLIDDHMDEYLQSLFHSFDSARPYVSLILSKTEEGNFRFTGRVWFANEWYLVDQLLVVGDVFDRIVSEQFEQLPLPALLEKRLERLSSKLGSQAARKLWDTTVMILGCGGTGSAAAHSLARSGVGRFILVDFDRLAVSNLERVHGAYERHVLTENPPEKISVVRDLIKQINPASEVTLVSGNILQEEVRALALQADLVLGCTDTEHGKIAVSELAYLDLVPAIQVNVAMEGEGEILTGEIVHITRYIPGKACAYCRDQVDAWRLTVELMNDEEKLLRKEHAKQALLRGDDMEAYWKDTPIVPTVGSLTTTAGELAAEWAKGMISGCFIPPHDFLEFNLLAPYLGVVAVEVKPKSTCACNQQIGHGEQSKKGRVVNAPTFWKRPKMSA